MIAIDFSMLSSSSVHRAGERKHSSGKHDLEERFKYELGRKSEKKMAEQMSCYQNNDYFMYVVSCQATYPSGFFLFNTTTSIANSCHQRCMQTLTHRQGYIMSYCY